MASLSNLVPRFNGTGNARQWLRKVECLRQHQKMTDEVYLNLLPLYLEGPAITWLDSLQPAPTTRAAFEEAFKQRYVQDSAAQTAFLGDQQRSDESGVAFIERVMEKTTGLEIPEVFLVQVIMNGLSTDLKSIVMPQGARTLQALSDQVRLAQKTVDATKTSSPNVSAVTTPDPAPLPDRSTAHRPAEAAERPSWSAGRDQGSCQEAGAEATVSTSTAVAPETQQPAAPASTVL
ncbi:uncharacterized protein LOC124271173 [Haliotis rubra]|uniref:uncharacterized protein LOC124271173 n=1 Tax=Haliotis rubra TaxID=36100 RepID=UPI001EE5D5D9|nr:uncharacterized protein LOC124271173 [Haliotis rubra]